MMPMQRHEDLAADIGKQFVWAGVLWIIGSVIFIVAAYKLCAQRPEPICPPEPDCPPSQGGYGFRGSSFI